MGCSSHFEILGFLITGTWLSEIQPVLILNVISLSGEVEQTNEASPRKSEHF